jgi:hypothetical protein
MIGQIAEVITAIAAIAAAVVAWEGLTAWKKQLHGSTDHEYCMEVSRSSPEAQERNK